MIVWGLSEEVLGLTNEGLGSGGLRFCSVFKSWGTSVAVLGFLGFRV